MNNIKLVYDHPGKVQIFSRSSDSYPESLNPADLICIFGLSLRDLREVVFE